MKVSFKLTSNDSDCSASLIIELIKDYLGLIASDSWLSSIESSELD
jgi:hypothetical protein